MTYLAPYTAHLAPYTAYIKPWSTYLTPYVPHLSPLLEPIHPNFPFAPIDVFGAMRLSSVVNWMASGAFDPPVVIETNEKGKKAVERRRPPLLRELLGLMIVVFGAETFLGMLTGAPPSWLVSLKIPLLFCITHVIQTRTPLLSFLPKGPSLKLELPLAIPDAIGRSLLLTKFSILPLLRPTAMTPSLPANPASLLLVPFILTVPFASIVFSTLNFFAPEIHLTTPLELRPGGWMFADSFVPVVIPLVFLGLIGPVQGWGMGLGVGEDEAVLICAGLTSLIFIGRAVYNFGHEAQVGGRRKIKTA